MDQSRRAVEEAEREAAAYLDDVEALAESWLDEVEAEAERRLRLAEARSRLIEAGARARAAEVEAIAARRLEAASEAADVVVAAGRREAAAIVAAAGRRAAAEREAAAISARQQALRDLGRAPGHRSRPAADRVSTEIGHLVERAQATMPVLEAGARALPAARPVRPFAGARPRRLRRLFGVPATRGPGAVGRPGLEPGPEG